MPFDPWQRFGEIWFSIMQQCCVPPICEMTIRRCPAGACFLVHRHRWNKAIAAWDAEHCSKQVQPREDV